MNVVIIAGVVLTLVGLMGLAGGIQKIYSRRTIRRRAVETTARVISIETSNVSDEGNVDIHYPIVRFMIGGNPVQTKVVQGRFTLDGIRPGQSLTVYYDPTDPSKVVLSPRDWPGGVLICLLMIVTLGFGIGLITAWGKVTPPW